MEDSLRNRLAGEIAKFWTDWCDSPEKVTEVDRALADALLRVFDVRLREPLEDEETFRCDNCEHSERDHDEEACRVSIVGQCGLLEPCPCREYSSLRSWTYKRRAGE